MADDTKPKMPPGFRWEPDPHDPHDPHGGDLWTIQGWRVEPDCGEKDAISIASELYEMVVRPAVEAATARVTTERDEAISKLYRMKNLEREFGNRLIRIIEYSVNALIDLPCDHASRSRLFKIAEIAQGDSIKSGKRSLECNSCGSRPEQWGLLKGDEKPGDQCPCCYLDDYDCDGTLTFVKIDDDDKGY